MGKSYGTDFIVGEDIPKFLRVLLVTDGTVTKTIEAYYNIELHVEKIADDSSDDKERQIRCIVLRDKKGKDWLFAKSEIFKDMLPFEATYDLEHTTLPLGVILEKYKLQTFRQIREIKYEDNTILSDDNKYFADIKKGRRFISRTYDILYGRGVAIRVKETFPIARYC